MTYTLWAATFTEPNLCYPAVEAKVIADIVSSRRVDENEARMLLLQSGITASIKMKDKHYEVWIETQD